jgi:hypothetical protein
MTNNDDPAVTIEGERIVLAPSRMEIGKLYPFTWRGKNAVVRVTEAGRFEFFEDHREEP